MGSVQELIARAEHAMAAGAYREAEALSVQALAADPAQARPCFLLGQLAAYRGDMGGAAQMFARAADLDPGAPAYSAQLARCLLWMNRLPEARAAAERSLALDPRDPETLGAVGLVLSRTGRVETALDLLRRAADLQPSKAERHHNLGQAQQFAGDFAGAGASFRRAVANNRDFYLSWLSLAELERQTPENNLLADLTELFDRGPDDPDRRLHLGHAVARTLEDLGDYPAALEWLLRAKSRKRQAVRYDPADDAALFEAAMTPAGEAARQGDPSEAPIFVVGMPRTGTTLMDRILSSHPQVDSVGELFDFMSAMKAAARTPSPRALDAPTLRAAAGVDPAMLGRAYLERVAPLRAGAPKFVDKMPLNVFCAGAIHRALPNARIVCLRRDSFDTAVSNFRQMFGPAFAYYFYALGLEDVGRYTLQFDRLAAHWRDTLPPDRFTEVRYEDLVFQQERTTRELLGFCGLPWDERCLDFHRHGGAVTTASAVHVRGPVHDRSVGRWRRYGDGLAPLLRLYAEHGVEPAAP